MVDGNPLTYDGTGDLRAEAVFKVLRRGGLGLMGMGA
jgi:hypothetical protein